MMAKRKSTADHVKQAAEAHTDLTVFYGVIALMEGGLISADSYRDADRIIRICRRAGAKCLRRYDAGIAGADHD